MIRTFGVVRESIVDGPGLRFVLFVQGCPHRCEGCHNPESHDPAGGYDCSAEQVIEAFGRDPLLRGITFSGGEPMMQAEALLPVARAVRGMGKDVMIYSGFTYEQLAEMAKADPAVDELLGLAWLLVDGRFELAQRDLSLRFRGSRNQRIIDLPATRAAGQVVLAEI